MLSSPQYFDVFSLLVKCSLHAVSLLCVHTFVKDYRSAVLCMLVVVTNFIYLYYLLYVCMCVSHTLVWSSHSFAMALRLSFSCCFFCFGHFVFCLITILHHNIAAYHITTCFCYFYGNNIDNDK